MKKADAILTADIELRAYTPICRIDNHWEAQKRKLIWLKELQKKHNCPVLDAGDLFDKRYKVNPSHELLQFSMKYLPDQLYTVPGNHDLPGKSIDKYSNSAMAVLKQAGMLIVVKNGMNQGYNYEDMNIYGYPWGMELKHIHIGNTNLLKIALIHSMVYKDTSPFPGCEGYKAQELMDLLPDFDLIITGHNHQTFTHRDGNRILVNPGSLMRNDADQIDHKPCVFLWYKETNRVRVVYVPIEQGVISREHIEEKQNRETRLDAFVEKLGHQTIDGINFQHNLEQTISKSNLNQTIIDKIWKYCEG